MKSDHGDLNQRSSMRRVAFYSIAVYFLIAVAGLVQYAIVSRMHGTVGLAEYSQLMRVRGILEYALVLMLPIAITRNLATRVGPSAQNHRATIIAAALLVGLPLLAVTTSFIAAFRENLAPLLFGSTKFEIYIPSFCSLVIGYSTCLLVAAIGRGLFRFSLVNYMQMLYVSMIPTFLLMITNGKSLDIAVLLIGIQALAMASVFVLIFLRSSGSSLASVTWNEVKIEAIDLLRYGSPRLLTIACTGAFNLALPWLISRSEDYQSLATLNGTMSIVVSSTIIISPIGLMILPVLAEKMAVMDLDGARSMVIKILNISITVGCIASVCSTAFLQPLFELWLNGSVSGRSVIVLSGSISIPLIFLLEAIRNPIDAGSRLPLNAITFIVGASVSLFFFLVCAHFLPSERLDVAIGFSVFSGYLLAGLTGTTVLHHCYRLGSRISIFESVTKRCLVIWCLASACSLAIQGQVPYWLFSAIQIFWIFVIGREFIANSPKWMIDLIPGPARVLLMKIRP